MGIIWLEALPGPAASCVFAPGLHQTWQESARTHCPLCSVADVGGHATALSIARKLRGVKGPTVLYASISKAALSKRADVSWLGRHLTKVQHYSSGTRAISSQSVVQSCIFGVIRTLR